MPLSEPVIGVEMGFQGCLESSGVQRKLESEPSILTCATWSPPEVNGILSAEWSVNRLGAK